MSGINQDWHEFNTIGHDGTIERGHNIRLHLNNGTLENSLFVKSRLVIRISLYCCGPERYLFRLWDRFWESKLQLYKNVAVIFHREVHADI